MENFIVRFELRNVTFNRIFEVYLSHDLEASDLNLNDVYDWTHVTLPENHVVTILGYHLRLSAEFFDFTIHYSVD